MVIDAHQHFWRYQTSKQTWIDDSMALLKRDFLPRDLQKELAENQVDGCVSIQAEHSESETLFLLRLAEEHPFIKGVVGWVDFRSAKVEERLSFFSTFAKLRGFRHIVQGEKDVNFLLRKDFLNGIGLLEKYGFTYDILVFPHQLGAVLGFVKQFPNQKFIIDHLAKPYIKDGFFEGWALLMKAVAQHQNVYCKISGMVTEADWAHWKQEDFVPYLEVVFEAFGMDRVLFGSDWPVCLLATNYSEAKGIVEDFIVQFSEDEQEKLFGSNAIRFYNLSTS